MLKLLVPALVLLPFVELTLLWLIGREVGFLPLVGLLVLTGLAGSWLARKEGARVLRSWQRAVTQRQVPEEGLLGGMLVFAAGVLLVIPGVVTDGVGLVLLLPPTRRLVAGWVRREVERRLATGSLRVTSFQGIPPRGPASASGPESLNPSPRPRFERGAGGEVDAEFTDEGSGRG